MNYKIPLEKSVLQSRDLEIREALTSEGTVFEAIKIARIGATSHAIEEIIKAAINYGQSEYAQEAASINNRKLMVEEIDLMIESAIKRGRNAYAINSAILGPSERTFQNLIAHISSNKHIWIVHELEKLIARKESPKYNGKKLDDPEKDFYCTIIERTKHYADNHKSQYQSFQIKKRNKIFSKIKSFFIRSKK